LASLLNSGMTHYPLLKIPAAALLQVVPRRICFFTRIRGISGDSGTAACDNLNCCWWSFFPQAYSTDSGLGSTPCSHPNLISMRLQQSALLGNLLSQCYLTVCERTTVCAYPVVDWATVSTLDGCAKNDPFPLRPSNC